MIKKFFSVKNYHLILDNLKKKERYYNYKVMHLSEKSDIIEIKKKFNEIVKEYHPDKLGENNYFLEVKKAYEILSKEKSKKIYDDEQINYKDNFKIKIFNKNIDTRIFIFSSIILIYYYWYLLNIDKKEINSSSTYLHYKDKLKDK